MIYLMKEVDFHTYCPKCEHKNAKESESPCTYCLDVAARDDGSRKPVRFEEASNGGRL